MSTQQKRRCKSQRRDARPYSHSRFLFPYRRAGRKLRERFKGGNRAILRKGFRYAERRQNTPPPCMTRRLRRDRAVPGLGNVKREGTMGMPSLDWETSILGSIYCVNGKAPPHN